MMSRNDAGKRSGVTGSIYRFSLHPSVVERVGGEPRRGAAPADTLQPRWSILELRVGRPGRWCISNASGGYVDAPEVWQWPSVVTCSGAADTSSEAGD